MAGISLLGCLQLLGLAAVLAHEALEAGPRFNPRTIGTEVLVAGLAVRCARASTSAKKSRTPSAERTRREFGAKTLG
jgi:hypothetical protein